ncbi:MAG: LacI family DNA-binding transcriptional regulator [Anaerolineales bacterium]
MKKRVKARDVAKLAGVSQSTVIFALHNIPGIRISDDARHRIQEAAQELHFSNYSAGDIPRRKNTKRRILALIERHLSKNCIMDAAFNQMLRGVHHAAVDYGFEILFAAIPAGDDLSRCERLLKCCQPNGVILSSPQPDDAALGLLRKSDIPTVIRGLHERCETACMCVNDFEGAKVATDHLIRLGHVKVGLLLHGPPSCPEVSERIRGYRQALLENDLAEDPELVAIADFTPKSGGLSLETLMMNKPVPTALFVTSDTVALGVMSASHRQGYQIPEDLAIVGFGDIPLAAHAQPALTTVHEPVFAEGWMAVDMLVRRITNREIAEPYLELPVELIVRQSCGAMNHVQTATRVRGSYLH